MNNGSVENEVIKWRRFPGGGARHCTEYLKIKPAKKFLIKLAKNNLDKQVINYLGLRINESNERRKRYENIMDDDLYKPHELMPSKYPKFMGDKLNIRFQLPIISWSTEEVFDYLAGEYNPLYDMGFDRVGCFPCLAGGDKAKLKAFNFDETGKLYYERAKLMEVYVTLFPRSANVGKPLFNTNVGKQGEKELGSGCSFCEI